MYNANKSYYFVGIGGSGMSGLALVLHAQGFLVSGSDAKPSAVVDTLISRGIQVTIGHRAENVPADCAVMVYSTAIDITKNACTVEATRRGIPLVHRADVLAERMRLKFGVGIAGAHGKTTTTSMTAAIFEAAAKDPTVIVGGQVKSFSLGGKSGLGNFLIAECCESDKSFLKMRPSIAVVTNIDSEHLSSYPGGLPEVCQAFAEFVNAVPFYGLAVLCIDDPHVAAIAGRYRGRKVTYGESDQAQLQLKNVHCSIAGVSYDVIWEGQLLAHIDLPMFGKHIALNSLAAIAVAMEVGIPLDIIVQALQSFSGVARRAEIIGSENGVVVISDYGHHPTEIAATLQGLRSSFAGSTTGAHRLRVVFQPHRYTRTRDCFNEFLECFAAADELVVVDTYAAGEQPIAGATSADLAQALHAYHPRVQYIPALEEAVTTVSASARAGDVLVCLGAGSIGKCPAAILEQLGSPAAHVGGNVRAWGVVA